MDLAKQIEAILFYTAEPVLKSYLISYLKISQEELTQGLETLRSNLEHSCLMITETDTSLQLVLGGGCTPLIEDLRKEELSRDIGKAGAETLAIILYRGPITRAEVDAIRGVNSTFIIRNLLIRGLVERRDNPRDARSFQYAITPALLNYLGLESKERLPDYEHIMNTLDTFITEESAKTQTTPEINPFHAS